MLKRKLNLKCLACNGDFGLSGRKYRDSYPDYITTCYATCKNCGKKYLVGDDGQDQLIIKEIIKQKKQKKILAYKEMAQSVQNRSAPHRRVDVGQNDESMWGTSIS